MSIFRIEFSRFQYLGLSFQGVNIMEFAFLRCQYLFSRCQYLGLGYYSRFYYTFYQIISVATVVVVPRGVKSPTHR